VNHSFKVLHIAAIDVTVNTFYLPTLDRFLKEGYQVHIACSKGQYTAGFQDRGYTVHPITIERRIKPLSNLKSLWYLYRLMIKERFDIVHVHTPMAAALGRVAAWAAQIPIIMYTAHGLYFHEHMPLWKKRLVIWAEKLLGYTTDLLFTVNSEDGPMLVREGVCPAGKVICIGTGLDAGRFAVLPSRSEARKNWGLGAQDKVIGFVGRLVTDKGILELGEAMNLVAKAVPGAKLLIVGDTPASERDQKAKKAFHSILDRYQLKQRVVFTGMLEYIHVPRAMSAIDLLVHPSYREGLPSVVLEAMASGKPVVATNIRGNRDAVADGINGLLVPVKNHTDLADAIIRLLSNPELARKMGDEGRRRVHELFEENIVIEKLLKACTEITRNKMVCGPLGETKIAQKRIQLWLKRSMDIVLSSLSLALLSVPFFVISVLIKLDSPGTVFFRQERIGKGGRPFHIWKFRTMVVGAVELGLGYNVAKDDSRITRMGKVLRNWGLDELPQLINVFGGEMSIVGPRPIYRHHVEHYDDFQRQRLLVKPGITSLAVIKGRNLLSWRERIKLDVWYVRHWSVFLDVKIILRTFWVVLVTRTGIYGAEGINDNFLSSMGRKSKEVDEMVAAKSTERKGV